MSQPAGKRNKFVTIEKLSEPQDAAGEPQPQWSKLANVWASIESVSGNESAGGLQVEAGVSTMVKMLFREDVRPGMRIVHKARTLNIVSAYDVSGLNQELLCQCKEVARA